jgi:hypothetical protein
VAEQAARSELEATEGDLEGWQEVIRTAIQLAGTCCAAYLKARPSVRRSFNDAVLEAVHVKDRRTARAEFAEAFAPLFSRPGSNKTLNVDPRGRYSNQAFRALLRELLEHVTSCRHGLSDGGSTSLR